MKTKKHLKLSKCYPKVIQKISESSSNVIQKEITEICPLFSCKYCGKKYKYRSGLSKHVRYSCDKNKDEDLKEIEKSRDIDENLSYNDNDSDSEKASKNNSDEIKRQNNFKISEIKAKEKRRQLEKKKRKQRKRQRK